MTTPKDHSKLYEKLSSKNHLNSFICVILKPFFSMKVGLLFPNSSPKQVKVNFNKTVSSQDGGRGEETPVFRFPAPQEPGWTRADTD